MDSISAFLRNQAARGKEMKVFDWRKAARLIAERRAKNASAGLQDDWEWTGGRIFKDGKPVPKRDTYTYLASTWATPEIEIDGVFEDCYVMQSEEPSYNADTYWPAEALEILKMGPRR